MGFFSSIGSAISSACSSIGTDRSHNKVEDQTHQKYQNDIKNFDISFSEDHSFQDKKNAEKMKDVNSLDDVKKYFNQK